MSSMTKKQLEEVIEGLNGKLDGMDKKIDALESLPARLAKMEKLLTTVNEENGILRKAMQQKEEHINSLTLKLNNLEQHHRSWSIRVSNLPIPPNEETNNRAVSKVVYDALLRPILQGAVDNRGLPALPSAVDTIEYAHILPAKDGAKKPVIVRFRDRMIRDAVFANKREHEPRSGGNSQRQRRADDRPGGYLYPFFEDLTKLNFAKMRAIANHESVSACWSSRGQLKYKLHDSDTVKSVRNVLDTVEKIIAQ
jgi:hypothetical protein